MKTHKETYPEQYTHPLVGKQVRVVIVKQGGAREIARGTLTRVVSSSFGQLAILDGDAAVAYSIRDCQPVGE
jgi:hypothetical protein